MKSTIAASVAALDLTPIKQKLMHGPSGEGWSPARADAVETEYRRFLTLMKIFPNEATAPLVDVDTFWHYHILDTMKYGADCDQAFGYFLHHNPYVGFDDAGESTRADAGNRMQALYEATFGEPYGAVAPAAAAWCGVAEQAAAGTAWCGVAKAAAGQTAWCGVADAAAKQTAWCGVTDAAAKQTAWCGVTSAAATQTAWCGVADRPAKQTAWCGVADTAAKHTAWCGVANAAAKHTAWCGVATAAAKHTAWCGVTNAAAKQTAWCGVTSTAAKATAWCGVARVIDTAPGVAIVVQADATVAA